MVQTILLHVVCACVCVWAASCVYAMCMDDEADVASLNPPGSSEVDAAALNPLNIKNERGTVTMLLV